MILENVMKWKLKYLLITANQAIIAIFSELSKWLRPELKITLKNKKDSKKRKDINDSSYIKKGWLIKSWLLVFTRKKILALS